MRRKTEGERRESAKRYVLDLSDVETVMMKLPGMALRSWNHQIPLNGRVQEMIF